MNLYYTVIICIYNEKAHQTNEIPMAIINLLNVI